MYVLVEQSMVLCGHFEIKELRFQIIIQHFI